MDFPLVISEAPPREVLQIVSLGGLVCLLRVLRRIISLRRGVVVPGPRIFGSRSSGHQCGKLRVRLRLPVKRCHQCAKSLAENHQPSTRRCCAVTADVWQVIFRGDSYGRSPLNGARP